jgi:hypothetical protein
VVRIRGATVTVCLVLLVLAFAGCTDESARHSPSDAELIEFIASGRHTLQDHRARCDTLVRDFQSRWREASGEETFPVLRMLASVESEIVWMLITWERMPDPEAEDVRFLNDAFFGYLGLVLQSSRQVSRAIGPNYRAGVTARARAAHEARKLLKEAEAAEIRLEGLMEEFEVGGGDGQE